jgi:hypothetical protein
MGVKVCRSQIQYITLHHIWVWCGKLKSSPKLPKILTNMYKYAWIPFAKDLVIYCKEGGVCFYELRNAINTKWMLAYWTQSFELKNIDFQKIQRCFSDRPTNLPKVKYWLLPLLSILNIGLSKDKKFRSAAGCPDLKLLLMIPLESDIFISIGKILLRRYCWQEFICSTLIVSNSDHDAFRIRNHYKS